MHKLTLILAAAVALAFAVPVITSAQALEGKVVVKSGERHEGRHHRKIVVIKHRSHYAHERHHRKVVVIKHRGHREHERHARRGDYH